jgi:hypothetical protein
MKPDPPSDMWAQLDALDPPNTRPTGTFTRAEYCERYRLRRAAGNERLSRLVATGKVVIAGTEPNGTRYYRVAGDS